MSYRTFCRNCNTQLNVDYVPIMQPLCDDCKKEADPSKDKKSDNNE